MIWPFKKRASAPAHEPDAWMDALWRAQSPAITRDEHDAAKERLDAKNDRYVTLVFPDGSRQKMIAGTVDLKDYTRRDGYLMTMHGYDRFGWPKGHPDSPATPAVSQAQSGNAAAEPRSLLKNPNPERETG